MAKVLMVIPITTVAHVSGSGSCSNMCFSISNMLKRNGVSSSIFSPEDGLCVEDYLVSADGADELLENIVCNYQESIDKQTAKADEEIIVVKGISCDSDKPYGSKLNLQIVKALDASVVFFASYQFKDNDALFRMLDTNLNYCIPIDDEKYLGCIVDCANSDADADEIIARSQTSEFERLKLLGVFVGDYDIVDADIFKKQIGYEEFFNFSARKTITKITPPAFRHFLKEKAQEADKCIILPEGNEPRTIQAANIVAEQKLAKCILLGKPDDIKEVAKEQNINLAAEAVKIIDTSGIRKKYVKPLVELRKAKGMTEKLACELLEDNVMLATMMLQQGAVDGLVSGAVHTTANTIRPALQVIKTKQNVDLVSSLFFMCLEEQVLVFADCAINPKPNAAELADIAIQSADSAAKFGIEPRIAMISYSSGKSGKGDDVEKVAEATELVKSRRSDILIDGPLQYDAALVESVAKLKMPDSNVAGKATVLIFSDLGVGNAVYKAVQRTGDIVAIGPMLQGLNKPVNDLSRGCLVEDIVYTIALTAIQARDT